MAEGIIIKRSDKEGNRMAFSREGDGRICVLEGTKGNLEYSTGRRVLWLISKRGRNVDFSRTYYALGDENLPPKEVREEDRKRSEGPIELIVYACTREELLILGEFGVRNPNIVQKTFLDCVGFVQNGELFGRHAAVYRCEYSYIRRILPQIFDVDELRVFNIDGDYDFSTCIRDPHSKLSRSLGDLICPYLED